MNNQTQFISNNTQPQDLNMNLKRNFSGDSGANDQINMMMNSNQNGLNSNSKKMCSNINSNSSSSNSNSPTQNVSKPSVVKQTMLNDSPSSSCSSTNSSFGVLPSSINSNSSGQYGYHNNNSMANADLILNGSNNNQHL
jgi:hypothetical protein